MGTFIIRPTILASVTPGSWFSAFTGETLLYALTNQVGGLHNAQNGPSSNGLARLSFFGPCFYLDGSLVPISFGELPAGFTPLTAIVKAQAANGGVPAGQVFFQGGPVGEESPVNQFYDYSVINPFPRIFTIYLNGMGVRSVALAGTGFSTCYDSRIEGTYQINQYPTFNPVVQNPLVPVHTGDKIVIVAPNGLSGVTKINIDYIDPIKGPKTISITDDPPGLFIDGVFLYWIDLIYIKQDAILAFYLPWGFGTFSGPIAISLEGTTFSGSVFAGILNILFADASGIYVLDKNQTNDILYFRDGYTTVQKQIMLSFNTEETLEDDFYSLLGFPRAIMSQNPLDEEVDPIELDYTIIATPQIVTVPTSVEIPSPFIRTAFIP